MSEDQLLDADITAYDEELPIRTADLGLRFANVLIDTLAMVGINFAMAFGIGEIPLMGYIVSFAYYTILEGTTGVTLGKLVTGTKVITEHRERVDMGGAALRSLSRFVPFEAFSFFGKSQRGWHDIWTKTYVVKNSEY